MGAKEIILMKLEELKRKGIRMYPLKELIEELASETPYARMSYYYMVKELEIKGKIKMVDGKGKFKMIVLNEQANNNQQEIINNGTEKSINNN